MHCGHSGKTVFNPTWQVMPAEFDDILFGHEIHDQTIEDLRAINQLVLISENDYMDDDTVQFLDGGYTNIVLSSALSGIQSREPARVTLKVIELYHLGQYFVLDEVVAKLEEKAAAEKKELESNKGIH